MTDYEVLGVSSNATDDEIITAYERKLKETDDKSRIELAYKRLKSIRPVIPCPKVKEEGRIYTVNKNH